MTKKPAELSSKERKLLDGDIEDVTSFDQFDGRIGRTMKTGDKRPKDWLPEANLEPDHRKALAPKCRALFFSGYSQDRIEHILELDVEEKKQLDLWIKGNDGKSAVTSCWAYQLRVGGDLAVKCFIKSKATAVEQTAGIALAALTKGVKNFYERIDNGYEAKTKELKDLTEIVTSLDKIWRLENEQATEIIQKTGFSREEAMRIFKNDPFAPKDVILDDAEFKEIE